MTPRIPVAVLLAIALGGPSWSFAGTTITAHQMSSVTLKTVTQITTSKSDTKPSTNSVNAKELFNLCVGAKPAKNEALFIFFDCAGPPPGTAHQHPAAHRSEGRRDHRVRHAAGPDHEGRRNDHHHDQGAGDGPHRLWRRGDGRPLGDDQPEVHRVPEQRTGLPLEREHEGDRDGGLAWHRLRDRRRVDPEVQHAGRGDHRDPALALS